jgi:hypothetical protein
MANFFDQFDVVTPEQAGPSPQTHVTVGPQPTEAPNFFDQFDAPPGPDISSPGGIGAAFHQMDQGPQSNPADQRRMEDLASAYRQAPEGHGMAVDSRAQAKLKDVENNNPYGNATWQGLTFGFGDEIGAGIRTALGQGDGYGENLAVERELLRRQRQERPIGMIGAEVVGGSIPAFLLPGAGVARTGEAATTAATKAPGFIDRTADAIGAGATYGGLYGFGTGEGGLEGRLHEAGKGALIGGAGAGILSPVIEGVGAGGRAAWNAAKDYAAPFTQGGRDRTAATTLRDAATDPVAARAALENPNQNVPIVAGSRPTTFQETGDMGLGGLERAVETRRPEPFMQRRADQNQARVSMLEGVQQDGSPGAVVSALRQNLALLDQTGEATLQRVTRAAQEKTNRLGGRDVPEAYGASLRQSLSSAEDSVRSRERALWEAVDPDGTLALPTAETTQSAINISRNVPTSAKPMDGEERAIFQTAASYKSSVMPFRELSALRTRVSTEMRRELSRYGSTPVYARLTQLRGAIERDLETAVAGKAAQEADAVAAGAMRQEDTMLAQWARERSEWLDRRAQEARAEVGNGAGTSFGARSTVVSPASGGQGQSGRGFSDPTSYPGLSRDAGLAPNFDEDALERLRSATASTKERANTYGTKPVGDVLRRSGQEGPFSVSASVVPSRFFRPGPRGYEDVQALRRAAGTPDVMSTLRDYALSTLRHAAEGPDGVLDPAKVAAWRHNYADALRAFPEIDRLLKGPVEAAETIGRVAAARKQELNDYQRGMVGRLLGLQDPSDVSRVVGGAFSSQSPATAFKRLAAEMQGNPEAMTGLRKAVADHILLRLKSNTEAATSGTNLLKSDQFQTFMRQNEPALREIFSPGEIAAMKAIAEDLHQANRSNTAVKLPGRSNSPQDLVAQLQQANQPQSWLSRLITSGASIGAGTFAGGPWGGAAALLGTEALGALRRAGVQKIDDIITEAMLNPDLARTLLAKAPAPAPVAPAAVPRAVLPAAAMSVSAFKPEPPPKPLDARGRLAQALMSAPARTGPPLSPQQYAIAALLAQQ